MKSIREIFSKKLIQKTEPPSLGQRRQAIMSLPIDSNGTVFPDSFEAEVYKNRLTAEGYRVVEGTTPDGFPFLRPQTLAEFNAIESCFSPNGISKKELAGVLDEYSRRALARDLTDVPIYRKPPRDIQQS